jgi:type I restriction enzyme S subunit
VIGELRPYTDYKESGLPWLGRVPGHWTIKRGKSYLFAVDERSRTGKEELLTVSSARGVVPRKSTQVTMFKAASYAGHKLCWPGDLVINSLWAWAGGLGVSQHHGIISTAYSVYRGRPSAQVNPRFLHELVRSSAFQWELHVRSKGVWISRLQLTDTAFLDAPIPLPPPDEQAAIVRFLDWANGRLERAIRAKRKVIALLNEQKQAIIHRAVTRGLDPDVPLKPSGIPWLGDIPQHWMLKRFKFLAKVTSGQIDPRAATYRNKVLIAPNHIQSGTGRIVATETADEQGADSGKYLVRAGQVIYSKIRPNLRKACIAPMDCLCSADMYPITPRTEELSADYLLALLLSQPFTKFAVDTSMRVAMPKVNREALADCCMWYPDSVEQREILKFIAVQKAPIDTAISRLEREIELLREYRTRLVADVVTGKLDVRAAAARLPDEVVPDAVDDDAEIAEEIDGETEDASA